MSRSHHVRYGKTGSVDRELNTRTVEMNLQSMWPLQGLPQRKQRTVYANAFQRRKAMQILHSGNEPWTVGQ